MALVGYELERKKIDEKIQEIRSQLGPRQTITMTESAPAPKRRLSVAARRRIAAAQKKRWAAHRKQAAQAARNE
jgi:hypothetical protein